MELFSFFVVWGLMCWGVAALADTRGRSSFGFFLLSFVFSPLLGLIVVLVMKNLTEEAARETERLRENERREIDRKREHEKQLESLRAAASSQPNRNSHPAVEPAQMGSIADELSKLAALRDKGILSQFEFTTQKARLLGPLIESCPPAPSESSPGISISAKDDLSTVDNCKSALINAGCKVSSPSDNTWEILDSAGITRLVRSSQELKQLARRYQSS